MMMRGAPHGRGGPMGGGPMGRMGAPGAKARDFRGTMRKLLAYLSSYRLALVVVLVFAVASTAANIAGPKILGKATTKLFEGVLAQINGTGGIDFDYIGRIALQTLLLYLISAVFAYVQGWIMADVSTNIAYRFRRDIAEKINRMPLKYFDGTTHGEVLSRITNDADTVNQSLSQSLTQIVVSAVSGDAADIARLALGDGRMAGTLDWRGYEMVIDIPQEAQRLVVGIQTTGKGTVWARDFSLEVVDGTVSITASASRWNMPQRGPANTGFDQ